MTTSFENISGDPDGAEGARDSERLTAPSDDTRQPRVPYPIVGIGASAGGFEAYSEFLRACPVDAGIAYVLVQHLSPERESMLVELLGKYTAMPVLEVSDGQAIETDHVYVIRPGHTLTIKDGQLILGRELAARGHGRPVDDFFRSLAEEQQQRAVAVVFSGMGSNGTAGAQAVKAVGGLVIAQEPESAKYPSMPRSLIDAHLPDYILRPSEVPEALVRFTGQPYVTESSTEPTPRDEQTISEILAVLRTRTRHDFAGYRKPTLLRRVRRRMGLGQFRTLPDYIRALRQTPAEVTALADDLLIHVTGFFRDPEAWSILRKVAIDPLVEMRPNGAELRCWVSACATGEEAYSLAMLLIEAAEDIGKKFDIKIFATDMAERTLGSARAGVFPNGIESEVSPERLSQFFDKDDCYYRVRRELRELVVFAPQNVLQDPPFSRLDLATCRNLLIYLEPETQQRVLSLLHFGLREGGVLMLGSSESASLAAENFEPIDKRHRIFRRIGPTHPRAINLPSLVSVTREARSIPIPDVARPAVPTIAHLVDRTLLARHTPAAVVVNASGQIVHVHGDTSWFLTLPPGTPTLDLLAMANEATREALRAALQRVTDGQTTATFRNWTHDTTQGRRRVEIEASPLVAWEAAALYLITFRDDFEPPSPAISDLSGADRVSDDLQQARDELHGALEEMQSSNEELKAAHEEATSLNEELQSTNEELETSKEEMQSLNEELVTVNAQLQAKMSEQETLANDLGSLLTSTDIAVLFLDPKLRIHRFTPAVKDLLDLIPSDLGRPFVDLRLKFADPDLLADARRVLEKLVPIERAVASESGRHYLRRVLPYRTQDDRIDGVVVAFLDVTERRQVDAALRESEARFGALVRTGVTVVYRMSPDWGRMLHLDGAGFMADSSAPDDAWLNEYIPADDRASVLATVEQAIQSRTEFDLEHRVFRADGSIGWTHSRAVPIVNDQGEVVEWLGAASDVTARKETEAALRESEERFRTMTDLVPDLLWQLDPETRTGWVNRRWVEYTGYENNVGYPWGWEEAVHPEDRDSFRAALDRGLTSGDPFRIEHRLRRAADGMYRWFLANAVPHRDEQGRITRWFGAVIDVHDQREARNVLEVRVADRTADLHAEIERRKDLTRRLSTAQEDERQRVARDLHDSAGQLLVGLSLALKGVEIDDDLPRRTGDKLVEARRVLDSLAKELHELAVRLRPTSLDDFGLEPALQQLIAEWSGRTGVQAEIHVLGLGITRLSREVETTIYRVVQEALTNAAKYADARTVSVLVSRPDGFVKVVVEDDGVGFDPASIPQGRLGLVGIRERVSLVAGELEIESTPGSGTTIYARIPLSDRD